MPVELALDQMSVPEKLQLMEALWEDLSRNASEFKSPAWHREVLEECRRKAESGEERFMDLEAAKEDV